MSKISLIIWYKLLPNRDRTDGACETTDKIQDFCTEKYIVVTYECTVSCLVWEIFVSPTQEWFFSPSQKGPRFLVYHICISKLIFKAAFMKNTKILDKALLEYFLIILPSLSCFNFNQMKVRGVCFVFALYRPVVILLAGLPLLLAEICIFLLSPRLRISQIQFSHLSHFANDTARANI